MNYYDILKVSKTASQQEIRTSYKKLIKKYHPDIYKGNHEYAEKITKELNDAYTTLSNLESRKEYDLSLEEQNIHIPEQQYYQNIVTEDKIQQKQTLEQILRKKIYNIVDEKTKSMSQKSKVLMIIVIILIALLLMLLAIQDFINVVKL